MKILSAQPATLAKTGDLVDRNVSGDVEIFQEALFPVLQFPSTLRPQKTIGTGVTNGDSTTVNMAGFHAGGAVVEVFPMVILTKGIWRISWTAIFISDMVSINFLTQDGLIFVIVPNVGAAGSNVVFHLKSSGSIAHNSESSWLITIEDPGAQLQLTHGATAIGVSSSYAFQLRAEKLY